MTRTNRPHSNTLGFTLLEVILALGILALALATIGEIVRNSLTNSRQAAQNLEAEIVAQSVIDQIKCGVIEIEDAGPMQMSTSEALAEWQVQIVVEPTPIEQLLQVRVLVGQTLDGDSPADCVLTRWFQDPDFAANLAAMDTSSEQ